MDKAKPRYRFCWECSRQLYGGSFRLVMRDGREVPVHAECINGVPPGKKNVSLSYGRASPEVERARHDAGKVGVRPVTAEQVQAEMTGRRPFMKSPFTREQASAGGKHKGIDLARAEADEALANKLQHANAPATVASKVGRPQPRKAAVLPGGERAAKW